MKKIEIKPLSVNEAWKGKRFKTPAYQSFEKACLYMLPNNIVIPVTDKYEIHYRFGFSNKLCDLVNPEKLITDILCKKYGFDDRYIYRMVLERENVERGKEFFEFEILAYTPTE